MRIFVNEVANGWIVKFKGVSKESSSTATYIANTPKEVGEIIEQMAVTEEVIKVTKDSIPGRFVPFTPDNFIKRD